MRGKKKKRSAKKEKGRETRSPGGSCTPNVGRKDVVDRNAQKAITKQAVAPATKKEKKKKVAAYGGPELSLPPGRMPGDNLLAGLHPKGSLFLIRNIVSFKTTAEENEYVLAGPLMSGLQLRRSEQAGQRGARRERGSSPANRVLLDAGRQAGNPVRGRGKDPGWRVWQASQGFSLEGNKDQEVFKIQAMKNGENPGDQVIP